MTAEPAVPARAAALTRLVLVPGARQNLPPPLGPDELSRFAESLADELRTPIGAVRGFGKTLDTMLDADAPQRMRHYVERILAAGQRLDEYVQALVALSHASHEVVRAVDVDLSLMAHQVLDELRRREPDRRVSTVVQDQVRAHGDPSLLRVVLENLLGNAWKFTGRRVTADIRFSAQPGAAGRTVYRVHDNGVGFDGAYAHKLFGDFQRLHSQAEFAGAGLGLANVRRIVARHGGRVWAQSHDGRGATFWFTLAGAGAVASGGSGGAALLQVRRQD